MTYIYRRKSVSELETIAEEIRREHPARQRGYVIDIELILDDLNIDIVFRKGLNRFVEGYLSRDRHIIVMDETRFTNPTRARFTLAEEFCHRVLEEDLWKNDDCEKHRCDRIPAAQHRLVEEDARKLAGALLMPRGDFTSLYSARARTLKNARASEQNVIRESLKEVAQLFEVSPFAAAFRALDLKLISRADLNRLFPS